MTIFSQQTIQSVSTYAEQFSHSVPFRHIVIENFFDKEFCQRVLDDFPVFENRFALNEMGEIGGKAVRTNVRDLSPTYRELDCCLQTEEFLGLISKITGIPDLLYDEDYFGGGTHENRDGQKLDAHVDFNYQPRTNTHRRLNLIVYLNHEWDDSWGGSLELHSNPWNPDDDRRTSILPLFNRAVIFETNEISWHGFKEIHLPESKKSLSRKSFAIYLYTSQRPAGETSPSHATIYVPDSMPSDWEPNRILSTDDLDMLKQRFAGLRGQLRFLYEREKRDSAKFAAVEHALGQARNAWRLPVQGYVKQPDAASGIWLDRWVSTRFRAQFIPQRTLRGLELELWAPDRLPTDQVLSIGLNDRHWEHHVAKGTQSNIKLNFKCASGAPVDLSVDAATCFVPAQVAASSDSRQLAWVLRDIQFLH
jgi:Rps23 Pro-64 3,4-dihydroxylase Tpa1-like proline 4-hydroxylase